MSLAEIAKVTWEENILFSALVELTYRCNLDCFFCYNDVNLKGTPLEKEQYFRFFEDLRDIQVLHLALSGGEPLAHPDFLEIGAKAKELGFLVRIKSNGHALRGNLARRIKDEVDPFAIELSLHGATAETHDRQTRVKGSFDRLMANIPEMIEVGLRVRMNSTLTAWNEHETEGLMAIADRIGVGLQIDPEVTGKDDGDKTPISIAASREAILRLFHLQRQRLATHSEGSPARQADRTVPGIGRLADGEVAGVPVTKHCGAGSSTIAVDPYGNVYPCVQWRWAVGNLHQASVKEMWASSGKLEEIRRLNSEAKKSVAVHGDAGKLMGFCPGIAIQNTGSPTKVYDAALGKMELHQLAEKETASTLLPIVK